MSELFYMLTYTLIFSLFFTFLRIINIFLTEYEEYHGINFVSMTGLDIKSLDDREDMEDSENTVYIQDDIFGSGDFQRVCGNVDDDDSTTPNNIYSGGANMHKSVYCLAELKESGPGFYEGRWFR